MKKYMHACIFLFIVLLADVAVAFTEDEAQNQIRTAQQLLIQLDNTLRLRQYIPYDIYGDALTELLEARSLIAEKNFNRAYFKASMARVKFETLPILAEAREVREKILIGGRNVSAISPTPVEPPKQKTVQRDTSGLISLYPLIINASLERKGDVFRRNIPDSLLFAGGECSLSPRGKKILDSIIKVVQSSSPASLTIAGHSSQKDYTGFTRIKAEAVSQYLRDAGVKADRITVVGLGDSEVMETPVGRIKVDRIEVIIGGIDID